MPELPEVETSLRGIQPDIVHQKVSAVIIRHSNLRYPIPKNLNTLLINQKLNAITRRGKYLLFHFPVGTMILHLGMSGRLRMHSHYLPPQKHDHVDVCFANKKCLRFTDPRRFGALLFTSDKSEQHFLLAHLGKEPLNPSFNGKYLYQKAKNKKIAIKHFIMNSKIVVGIGNIYANEALFLARINPEEAAGKISLLQYNKLAQSIKTVLRQAIKVGGTTLKDFNSPSGKPGYFLLQLHVYGRKGKPCLICHTPLVQIRLGQRSTVYCTRCQKLKAAIKK